jgi:Protein of unknown function (DUF4013)
MEAIKFAFSTPDWTMNLLLGLVFTVIPVVGPLALAGWHAEIHQRLVRRHPQPIPKLDFGDFMHYLERGLGPFVVNLALTLPLIFVSYFFMFIAGFASVGVGRATNEPALTMLVLVFALLGGAAMIFFFSVLLNAALTRVELTEAIGPSLSPGAMYAYGRRIWAKYFVAMLGFSFLAWGLLLVGLLLCGIGLYAAAVAVGLGSLHLRWQLYEQQLAQGGESIPLKPPVQLPSEARMGHPPYPAQGYPPQGY